MSYGENFGTGTLTNNLAYIAGDIRARRDNGEPADQDMLDDCWNLFEGSLELWKRLMAEVHE